MTALPGFEEGGLAQCSQQKENHENDIGSDDYSYVFWVMSAAQET